MRAYLIDPERQTVTLTSISDRTFHHEARTLIGADDLDYAPIGYKFDTIWVWGRGLISGNPIHAFKLPTSHDPFAGRAIVIGANQIGKTTPPNIPLECLRSAIVWLGIIVPEVTPVNEENGVRMVVTYSREKRR